MGFLITGGIGDVGRSAQVVSIEGKELIKLDDLPEPRSYHTTDGSLTCGGLNTSGIV